MRQHRRAGVEQGLHADVVLRQHAAAAGHAEGADLGVPQLQLAGPAEELGVLVVGERIAPLDVVEAQLIEPAGDQQLVLAARS